MPAVTICSGRSAQYVALMLQAIDGRFPAVFENGAGLYVPESYHFLIHPGLGDGNVIPAARRRLEKTLLQSGEAYFQPGKDYSLTLFPNNSNDVDQLYRQTVSALDELSEAIHIVTSTSCVNVLPRGIDKGKGVQFLAEISGCSLHNMLGVGDSDVDLQFLPLLGFSAAPANANPQVKSAVQYVSPYPTRQGVRDILQHYGIPLG